MVADPELVSEILDQIERAIAKIISYGAPIGTVEDFTCSADGEMRLDAIAMMLIAIGENLKKLDRYLEASKFEQFPDVDWRGAKGIRDFLSHAYFDIRADVIFGVCRQDIPRLQGAIQSLKSEYQQDNL